MHETIFSAFALSHRFYDGMQPAYNQKTRAALYSITTLRAALHLNSTKITESEVLAALQNTHTDAHPASVSCRHALRRVDPLRCAHLQATGPGQLAPTCSLPADRVSGSTVPASFSAKSSISDSWATQAVHLQERRPRRHSHHRPVAVGTPTARLYATMTPMPQGDRNLSSSPDTFFGGPAQHCWRSDV